MKKIYYGIVAVITGIIIGLYVQPILSKDNVYEEFEKFKEILFSAQRNYMEEVDTHQLMEAAIVGMLSELDPHSTYIDAEDMKRVSEEFDASFDGIGVEFDLINDTITIVSPIADGPSEKLGIIAGDKIVKIDGTNAVGIKREDVPKKLKGPKGTKVNVDIKRNGIKDFINFTITRDKIPLFTLDARYLIEGTDIGYVSIGRFAQTTHEEMVKATNELKTMGMKKLILDLRGNPGGYMNQAIDILDEFMPTGDTLVFTKGRKREFNETHISTFQGTLEDMPVIVLINGGSASASEIVSGAIQDLDRGLVVGQTSYGKGLVQRQYPVKDGSAYRLTISRYYTPSGRCIQRPFKDKEEYRKLVGRLELEEGSNTALNLEKYKAKLIESQKKTGKLTDKEMEDKIDLDSIDIHYTKTGRIVIGGGGVIPDYIVKPDTNSRWTAFVSNLFGKSVFNDYIANFTSSSEGKTLKNKYQNRFSDYYANYAIEGKVWNDFVSLCKSKVDEWKEDDFKKDENELKLYLKALIAKQIWDRSKQIQIFSQRDLQLKKAITLFPEAKKIAENRNKMNR